MGRGMKLYEPYSRYSSGHLVDKLVVSLVDNTDPKRSRMRQCGEAKRLKRQHGQKLNQPHNPKVGGSNPSPAIGAASKRPFFIALEEFITPPNLWWAAH